jgi:hypothetical protein
MGVTPSPSPWVFAWSRLRQWPFMKTRPLMFELNAFTCAQSFAYKGAHKQISATKSSTKSAPIEALFRRSWRSDDRQGLSGPLAVAGA